MEDGPRVDVAQLVVLLGGAQGRVVHVLGPQVRRLEVERVDGDDRLVLHDARPVHGRELNVGQEPPR